MTTAIMSALSGIAGMFSGQGKSAAAVAPPQPRIDTSTQAIAMARDGHVARTALKNADRERLYAILTDPQVLGLACVLGGVLLSANAQFHPNRSVNGQLRGIAAGSCVLLGLGRAGVGDMTTLSVAALTAGTLGLAGLAEDIDDGSGSGGSSSGGSAWSQFWRGLVNFVNVPASTL